MSPTVEVLIVTATAEESSRLRDRLARPVEGTAGRRPLVQGMLGSRRVGVLSAGMGKSNVSMSLGAALQALEKGSVGLVLMTGVGGAYPSAGLAPGDLAVATEEVYGDEGVETAEGFRGLEETGIPLWEQDGRRYFNRFPVHAGFCQALAKAGRRVGRVAVGPFVTVSTVTGSRGRARVLEETFGAVCENMEGAAAAHTAAVFGIPFAELRGISNVVGPRDRDAWQLDKAAAVAQEAVLCFLKAQG